MTHCSDDDLVLHHYGESPGAGAHVAICPSCAARARDLALLLDSIREDVPERGAEYGAEVWERVQPRLSPMRPRWQRSMRTWALAAAAALVIAVSGFLAGRFSNGTSNTNVTGTLATNAGTTRTAASGDEAARRVLLLSVADHLERSDRVLTEIMNAPGGSDLATEQQWATDLVATNRLFRQDAIDAHESSVADVLDELERTLLDIVHRPDGASAADLDQIRRRIDSAALLFKVRMMTNELRNPSSVPLS